MLPVLLLTSTLTIPLPVLGHTWVVDDTPGPGVDFTTLQAAFDAAQTNDVILVQPGSYLGGTIRRGFRVIGQGGPQIRSWLTIDAVPAGWPVVVSGLRHGTGGPTALVADVRNCLATVVVDDVEALSFNVIGSRDVRVHERPVSSTRARLALDSSRVEVAGGSFDGFHGFNSGCDWLGPGWITDGFPACDAAGAELHLSRASFRGGDGGDTTCWDQGGLVPCGIGGTGVELRNGATARIAGRADHVLDGGAGGTETFTGHPPSASTCPDGIGLVVVSGSAARSSGVTIDGVGVSGGSHVASAVPDPTLRLLEPVFPGSTATLRVAAPPGASARLAIGALPVVQAVGGALDEDVLVARGRAIDLGVVPSNGVLGWNLEVPATWPAGTVVFAQATVELPGGETRRTNSVPIVVR